MKLSQTLTFSPIIQRIKSAWPTSFITEPLPYFTAVKVIINSTHTGHDRAGVFGTTPRFKNVNRISEIY
jgi:hypothetical protein